MPPETGIEASFIDAAEDLEALVPEWTELVDGLDAMAAFGSPVQVRASWQSWSADRRCRLHVVAFRAAGRLVAVAPLVRRTGRHGFGSIWWMHNLTPFYTGFPCLPRYEEAVFAALAAHLEALRGVLGLHAHWVPQDTTLDRFLTRFESVPYSRAPASVVSLQSPPLTRSRSRAWNYDRRRLERHGRLTFGMVSDPERVAGLCRWTLVRKRAQLMERGNAPDWIRSRVNEDWFTSVHAEEARRGRATVFELALDGQVIATQMFLVHGDTAIYTHTAFDPQYAAESPGWHSMVLCLDLLREQGVRQAHLMVGLYKQKLRLAPELLQVRNHFRPLFPRSLAGVGATLFRRGRDAWRRLASEPAANHLNASLAWLDRAFGNVFLRLKFRLKLGYPLDLKNPRTKNEKIQWRKLHDRSPLIVAATDKYAMRALVRDMLGKDATRRLFAKLYQVSECAEALRFDALPQQYVVKPTHGCGWFEIVRRNDPAHHARLRHKCQGWLRRRYGARQHEWAYSQISPRIMVEECITEADGTIASDLKFYVIAGRVAFVWSYSGRFSGAPKDVFYNRVGAVYAGDVAEQKPPGFDDMLRIAEEVGAYFDYVRVDFLFTRSRFVLNELTLYNASGFDANPPPGVPLYEFDRHLGDLWQIGQASKALPAAGADGKA